MKRLIFLRSIWSPRLESEQRSTANSGTPVSRRDCSKDQRLQVVWTHKGHGARPLEFSMSVERPLTEGSRDDMARCSATEQTTSNVSRETLDANSDSSKR